MPERVWRKVVRDLQSHPDKYISLVSRCRCDRESTIIFDLEKEAITGSIVDTLSQYGKQQWRATPIVSFVAIKLLLRKWHDGGIVRPEAIASIQGAKRARGNGFRYVIHSPLKSVSTNFKDRIIVHMRTPADAAKLVADLRKTPPQGTAGGCFGKPGLFFGVGIVWFSGPFKELQPETTTEGAPSSSSKRRRLTEVSFPAALQVREQLQQANVEMNDEEMMVAVAALNMVGLDAMEALIAAMRRMCNGFFVRSCNVAPSEMLNNGLRDDRMPCVCLFWVATNLACSDQRM
ncbi:hypothetical protein HDU85_005276 [Gaertneriomyces sp. JEL0708]|nr:hypothetical protein HDU85_005276 [Gaertneriomyces sp. JEL0708]